MRRLGLVLLLCATGLGAASHAQNPPSPGQAPRPTGLLMGVVVDPLDGQPVPDAQVTLGGTPFQTGTTELLTDADGRFVFLDLPKGTYTITATKPGYAEGAHGRRRALGLLQPLVLADGERIGDLRIPIWKHAAVTGRIIDESGEPLVGLGVRVLRRTVVAGRRTLAPGAMTRTDDRGMYRIGSLTPADYVVVVASTQATAPESVVESYKGARSVATKPGESDLYRDLSFSGVVDAMSLFERYQGARVGTLAFLSTGSGVRAGTSPMPGADGRMYLYPTRYYPAASTTTEAAVIALRSGEERPGVDVQLQLTPTSRVSGTVTGPDGHVLAALSLVPDADDLSTDVGFETATTLSDATGRFTFLGVPAGRYQLRAIWLQVPVGGGGSRGAPPPARSPTPTPAAPPLPSLGGFTLWAAQPITVGATDIRDVAVTMKAGFRISGRAEFVGAAAQPQPDAVRRMSANIDPADGRPFVSTTIGRGQFDEQGRLSTYQLPPGRYYLRINNNAPPGWTLKSATVGGQDISNLPVRLDRDVTGVVITFTDRPSSLSGQVTNASGTADSSATVLVFPAEPGAWTNQGAFPNRLRAIRVDRDGRFSTSGLPGGDYVVVAIAEESSADWQDPIVLQALSRVATTISLGDGEARTMMLKTAEKRLRPGERAQRDEPRERGWGPARTNK